MDRMSPLDATFLHIEDGITHMHIASCALFEGPAPAYEEVVRLFAGKLPLVPRYRQKVRFVPGAVGRPVWVDDPHFRIDYHLRHTALPPSGTDQDLRNLMGRLMSQELDRNRPLWEAWVVEGLADGQMGVGLQGPSLHGRRHLGHRSDGRRARLVARGVAADRRRLGARPGAVRWRPRPRCDRRDVHQPERADPLGSLCPSGSEAAGERRVGVRAGCSRHGRTAPAERAPVDRGIDRAASSLGVGPFHARRGEGDPRACTGGP